MVKRRSPIRLGVKTSTPLSQTLNSYRLIDSQDIIDNIKSVQAEAANDAYKNYNASYYTSLINDIPTAGKVVSTQVPDATRVEKPIIIPTGKRTLSLGKVNKKGYGNQQEFTNSIYNSYYKAVRPRAKSDADAARQATLLTRKAVYETQYGKHLANTHNYGGHRTKNGWLAFNSMDDFTTKDVALLDSKWGNWRNAKNGEDFINIINTDYGKGKYATKEEYQGYLGTNNRVNSYLNMNKRKLSCGGKIARPKAWLGALIGAATSIFGSVMNAQAEEDRIAEQKRIEAHKNAVAQAKSLSESLNLSQDAQKEYENRFRLNYRTGGRRAIKGGLAITDGGYAIPMGRQTYLLRGASHNTINEVGKTGIGIDVSGKNIEAEGGEVIQKTPKEVRIFSDTMVLPNGMTPAEAIKYGADKTRVFNMQQEMNGDYGIKSKRRLRNGGKVTLPVERIKYNIGGNYVTINGKKVRNNGNIINLLRGVYPNIGTPYSGGNLPTDNNTGLRYQKIGGNGYPIEYIGQHWINSDDAVSAEQPNKISYNNSQTPVIATKDNSKLTPSRGAVIATKNNSRKLASRGAVPSNIIDRITFTHPEIGKDSSPSDVTKSFDFNVMRKDLDPNKGLTDNQITKKELGFGSTVFKGKTTNSLFNNNNKNKWGLNIKGSDWIGLGADLIGSLGSTLINLNAADSVEDPNPPVLLSPAKLITNHNIAPRLSEVANTRLRMLRDSDEGVSSAGRLARRNQINLATNSAANQLWGEKTNKEVELLNADALNQQGVHEKNVGYLNDYYNRLIDSRNRRGLIRAQAWQTGFSGLSDAVGNFLDQGKQRYSDEQAMRYYMALLPEEGRNWFIRNRVDMLRRGGRIS